MDVEARDAGTIEEGDDGATVRFVRDLPATPEEVWEALTVPDRVRRWLADVDLEPRLGGRVRIGFDDAPVTGVVEVWDPPRELAYTWVFDDGTPSAVCFRLAPAGGGTRLVLEHRGLPGRMATGYAPGWHAYLDRLGAVLADEVPPVWDDRFEELFSLYAQASG